MQLMQCDGRKHRKLYAFIDLPRSNPRGDDATCVSQGRLIRLQLH